jgi:hypothetical protein
MRGNTPQQPPYAVVHAARAYVVASQPEARTHFTATLDGSQVVNQPTRFHGCPSNAPTGTDGYLALALQSVFIQAQTRWCNKSNGELSNSGPTYSTTFEVRPM